MADIYIILNKKIFYVGILELGELAAISKFFQINMWPLEI